MNIVLQQMHNFVPFECEAFSLQNCVWNLLEYFGNICFIYLESFYTLVMYNLLTSNQIDHI
jgi:hypothetical protein